MFTNTNNMFGPRTRTQPANGTDPDDTQLPLSVMNGLYRRYWPFITASIIAFFMLIFGLAVAGLEAANLELGSSADTTSIKIPISSSSSKCGGSSKIGVGVWSGAIIAVAAISIFIINCASNKQHWAHIAMVLVGASALFSITNVAINSKTVREGVISGGFNSSDPTQYRLAAAQIPAASLSFLTCLTFLLMYLIVVGILIRRRVKQLKQSGYQRQQQQQQPPGFRPRQQSGYQLQNA